MLIQTALNDSHQNTKTQLEQLLCTDNVTNIVQNVMNAFNFSDFEDKASIEVWCLLHVPDDA